MLRAACSCSMECGDTIPDGVDGLALRKGVLNEANVAGKSGLVKTKVCVCKYAE